MIDYLDPDPKPKMFIGSSKEGLKVAEHLQLGLDDDVESTVWSQGVFGLSKGNLENLAAAVGKFDFAVLVLSPDDLVVKRGRQRHAPRDNVLFELGLFMGAFGRSRVFIVHARDAELDLPSDLSGVTTATYAARQDGNLRAALGASCTLLKEHIYRSIGAAVCDALDPEGAKEQRQIVARRRRRRSLGQANVCGPRRDYGIVNISVTGALLETDAEIEHGHVLDLELHLDDGRTAQVTARVVRVQEPDWGKVGGVGVAFTKFEGDAKETIDEYVNAELTLLRRQR